MKFIAIVLLVIGVIAVGLSFAGVQKANLKVLEARQAKQAVDAVISTAPKSVADFATPKTPSDIQAMKQQAATQLDKMAAAQKRFSRATAEAERQMATSKNVFMGGLVSFAAGLWVLVWPYGVKLMAARVKHSDSEGA